MARRISAFRPSSVNSMGGTPQRARRPKAGAANESEQGKAALEVGLQVFHRFKTDCDAQQAFVDAGRGPGFRGNAAMRGGGGMGNSGLGIAEIGGNGQQLAMV